MVPLRAPNDWVMRVNVAGADEFGGADQVTAWGGGAMLAKHVAALVGLESGVEPAADFLGRVDVGRPAAQGQQGRDAHATRDTSFARIGLVEDLSSVGTF